MLRSDTQRGETPISEMTGEEMQRTETLQLRKEEATHERRLQSEMYRRRRRTCIKKVHELSQLCSADVYLLVRRRGYYHIYTSTESGGWPPSEAELVSLSCNANERLIDNRKKFSQSHTW